VYVHVPGIGILVPFLMGLATWYEAAPGAVTRSGTLYSPSAMACAVDQTYYPYLVGRKMAIVWEKQVFVVEVNDSGAFLDAGLFTWNQEDQLWYEAQGEEIGCPVVVDLPEETHKALLGGETRLVELCFIVEVGMGRGGGMEVL